MTAFSTISELNRAIEALEPPSLPVLANGILRALRTRLLNELDLQRKDIQIAIRAAYESGASITRPDVKCSCGDPECDRGHDQSL